MSRASKIRRRRERRTASQHRQEVARAVVTHGDTTGDPKFDRPRTAPCPDCNLENRLRATDLRPERIGRIPLRPSRLSKWRPLASAGCETCGGAGEVHLDYYDQCDPYDVVARSESRESLARLELWRKRQELSSSVT